MTTTFQGVKGNLWGSGSVSGSASLKGGLSASAIVYAQYDHSKFSYGKNFQLTNTSPLFTANGVASSGFMIKFGLEADIDIEIDVGGTLLSFGAILGTEFTPTLTYDSSSQASSKCPTSTAPAAMSFDFTTGVHLNSIVINILMIPLTIPASTPTASASLYSNTVCEGIITTNTPTYLPSLTPVISNPPTPIPAALPQKPSNNTDPNANAAVSSSSSTVGMAVGLTMFFVIAAAVAAYAFIYFGYWNRMCGGLEIFKTIDVIKDDEVSKKDETFVEENPYRATLRVPGASLPQATAVTASDVGEIVEAMQVKIDLI